MKIEFRCQHCDQLLRVAATYAGQWIVCPECRSSLSVPEQELDGQATSHWLTDDRPIWSPQAVSLWSILRDSWAIYVQNLWLLLAVACIDLILLIVGTVLILVPAVGTFAVLWKAIGIPPPVSVLGMFLVLALGFMYLFNAMTCCQTKFFLKVARGEPTSILDAFHLGWKKGAITMLPTVFAAMCLSGLLLFVVPGVLVYIFFWPSIFIWADDQTGGRNSQAFPLAKDLSLMNMGTSTGLAVISLVMKFFGFFLFLFSESFLGVLRAVAYLQMSGQEVTGVKR